MRASRPSRRDLDGRAGGPDFTICLEAHTSTFLLLSANSVTQKHKVSRITNMLTYVSKNDTLLTHLSVSVFTHPRP